MALFGGKSSIATLEAQARTAQEDLAAAEVAFTKAVQAMEQPPIELSDDQVGDLVGVKNLAEVRLVKARAALRRAELALETARNETAEKDQAARRSHALKIGHAAKDLVRKELAAAIKGLLPALKAKGEADIVIMEYNQTVPATERLACLDDELLCSPVIPERELERVREVLWINGHGGDPYPPEIAKDIEEQPDGSGRLIRKYPNGHPFFGQSIDRLTRRRVFDKITYSPAVPGRGPGGSLAEVLRLPGLGGEIGWQPVTGGPSAVLAALARLERGDPQPARKAEPQTRLMAVSPILNSRSELLAWERKEAGLADAAE